MITKEAILVFTRLLDIEITTKEAILLFTTLLDVEVIDLDFRVVGCFFEVHISAGQGMFTYSCNKDRDSIIQIAQAANKSLCS